MLIGAVSVRDLDPGPKFQDKANDALTSGAYFSLTSGKLEKDFDTDIVLSQIVGYFCKDISGN